MNFAFLALKFQLVQPFFVIDEHLGMALIDIGDADDFQRPPLVRDAHGRQDIRAVADADFSADFRVGLLRLIKFAVDLR